MENAGNHIYLRPAAEDDYKNIPALFKKVFSWTPGLVNELNRMVHELKAGDSFDAELSVVVISNTDLIGYLLLSNIGIKNLPGLCGVAITVICIAPEYQRQGIGSFLMTYGIKQSRDLFKEFIVAHENPVFLRKFGFSAPTNYELAQPLMRLLLTEKNIDILPGNLEYPNLLPIFSSTV